MTSRKPSWGTCGDSFGYSLSVERRPGCSSVLGARVPDICGRLPVSILFLPDSDIVSRGVSLPTVLWHVPAHLVRAHFVCHVARVGDLDLLGLSSQVELSAGEFRGPAGPYRLRALIAVAVCRQVERIAGVELCHRYAVLFGERVTPALFQRPDPLLLARLIDRSRRCTGTALIRSRSRGIPARTGRQGADKHNHQTAHRFLLTQGELTGPPKVPGGSEAARFFHSYCSASSWRPHARQVLPCPRHPLLERRPPPRAADPD